MDGVLADWSAGLRKNLEAICERENLPYPLPAVQTTWKLRTGIEWRDKLILEAQQDPSLYRDLPVIPGAREGLEFLVRAGHDVFLCSTPAATNAQCASNKLAWVREHLGEQWVDRTVLTADKTIVFGDYLIDDKPEITGFRKPTWEHIVFDATYNQETKGQRLKEWKDVCELLA